MKKQRKAPGMSLSDLSSIMGMSMIGADIKEFKHGERVYYFSPSMQSVRKAEYVNREGVEHKVMVEDVNNEGDYIFINVGNEIIFDKKSDAQKYADTALPRQNMQRSDRLDNLEQMVNDALDLARENKEKIDRKNKEKIDRKLPDDELTSRSSVSVLPSQGFVGGPVGSCGVEYNTPSYYNSSSNKDDSDKDGRDWFPVIFIVTATLFGVILGLGIYQLLQIIFG